MGLFSSTPTKNSSTKVKVLKEEPCLVTLAITVPPGRFKGEVERVFEGIQTQAKLPGFRPGKAPLEMVRQNFSDLAFRRARESLLQEVVQETIATERLEPVQPPVVKNFNVDAEQSVSFELEVERAPHFQLKSYKGIKIDKKVNKVEDADVSARLGEIQESNARLIESERPRLEPGLFAVVDYEGFVDGQPLAGAQGTQVLIDTANPQMISGLADGILGMEKNQTKEISVKFPQDSPSHDLAGKEAVFKVSLRAIKEKKLPSLDDETAKDLGCSSLDDLKNRIRKSLEERAERQTRDSLEEQLTQKLLEDHDFSVPHSLLEEQANHQLELEKSRWLQKGGREDEWLKNEPVVAGKIKPECERQLRLAYLVRAICRQEKIEVKNEEIEEAIQKIVGSASAQEKRSLEELLRSRQDRIASDIRHRKVFDFLITQAKIKEA